MKDKINVAELLRACPQGMRLNCTMYEDVYFDFVDELNIIHCYIQHEAHKTSITFNQHGTPNSDVKSKCIIFPKGKMTWEGFRRPFKDGDVVATDNGEWIGIATGGEQGRLIPTYCVIKSNGLFEAYLDIKDKWKFCRLATEEEKQKLFKAIKENGYKWNPETKTLEKMTVPLTSEKFYIRIGDIPSEEKSGVYNGDSVVGYEDGVSVYDCIETDGLYRIIMPFPLKEGQGNTYECLIQEITQCRYKIEKPRNVYLVSGMEVGKGYDNEPLIKDVKILKDLTGQFNAKKNDNTEEAKTLEKLIEPKYKVGDKVRDKNNHDVVFTITSIEEDYYACGAKEAVWFDDQDNYELVPNKFDIHTLTPLQPVLVRNTNGQVWTMDFFSHIINTNKGLKPSIICVGHCPNQCIPYKGNEFLRGTADECKDFYKTWE